MPRRLEVRAGVASACMRRLEALLQPARRLGAEAPASPLVSEEERLAALLRAADPFEAFEAALARLEAPRGAGHETPASRLRRLPPVELQPTRERLPRVAPAGMAAVARRDVANVNLQAAQRGTSAPEVRRARTRVVPPSAPAADEALQVNASAAEKAALRRDSPLAPHAIQRPVSTEVRGVPRASVLRVAQREPVDANVVMRMSRFEAFAVRLEAAGVVQGARSPVRTTTEPGRVREVRTTVLADSPSASTAVASAVSSDATRLIETSPSVETLPGLVPAPLEQTARAHPHAAPLERVTGLRRLAALATESLEAPQEPTTLASARAEVSSESLAQQLDRLLFAEARRHGIDPASLVR